MGIFSQRSLPVFVTTKKEADWLRNATGTDLKCFRLELGVMDEEDFSLLGDAAAVQRWCDAPNISVSHTSDKKIITYH